MRLLYFPRHGDAAIEMAILCKGAGMELDMAGLHNSICAANATAKELVNLGRFGVIAPTDDEIRARTRSRRYDAVIVHTANQVDAYHDQLKLLCTDLPLIVRQSNHELADLQQRGIRNFFSQSRRALARFAGSQTLLKPKFLNWSNLPKPNHDPRRRMGFASYIHRYHWRWPLAWRRFHRLNEQLVPQQIVNYGMDSPNGVVNDLKMMQQSRATVHLKDGGSCCFAVMRSMAMGTPVVMDQQTYHLGYFDGIDGILVINDLQGIARELRRLNTDDDYWIAVSESTYTAAQRQFTFQASLGLSFVEFVTRARPPGNAAAELDWRPGNCDDRVMNSLIRIQSVIDSRLRSLGQRIGELFPRHRAGDKIHSRTENLKS